MLSGMIFLHGYTSQQVTEQVHGVDQRKEINKDREWNEKLKSCTGIVYL